MGNTVHRVLAGECISSIANRYGFFWMTLWNLPENATLKNKRKNPNVLMPGDEVVVPDIRIREQEVATDAQHTFVRLGIPMQFRMQLLSAGQPRSGVAYRFDIEGQSATGKTDSEGIVKLSIPPGTTTGTLWLKEGETPEIYELSFGELNPIEDVSGVQQRLNNLGYDCKVTKQLDEQTLVALSTFRAERQLADSDSIDDATRDALLEAHGS